MRPQASVEIARALAINRQESVQEFIERGLNFRREGCVLTKESLNVGWASCTACEGVSRCVSAVSVAVG